MRSRPELSPEWDRVGSSRRTRRELTSAEIVRRPFAEGASRIIHQRFSHPIKNCIASGETLLRSPPQEFLLCFSGETGLAESRHGERPSASRSLGHHRFGIASTLAAAVAQASASVAPVPRLFTPSDSVR